MSNESVWAAMGMRCADCAYYLAYGEDDGRCVLAVVEEKRPPLARACKTFKQRGCISKLEDEAIAIARNRVIAEGVKKWKNPFGKDR